MSAEPMLLGDPFGSMSEPALAVVPSSAQLIDAFDRLFVGRRDVYAEGYPDPNKANKYRYSCIREPLTPDLLRAHLRGDKCLGVYPIVDNAVGWFAVDFDAPTDETGEVVAEPFAAALEAGTKQLKAFEAAGLHCYLERSRSGHGVHVWGFLDGMVDAGVVRTALKPLLTDHDIFESRDRMYPVQPSASALKEGFGNLIALPYNGEAWKAQNSCFLDAAAQPISPRVFLANVRTNAVAVIQHLAEHAPRERHVAKTGDVARTEQQAGNGQQLRPAVPLMGALKLISPYGCAFMRHCWVDRRTLKEPEWYAAIQQCTAFKYGREFAHALSRDYKGYNPAEVNEKYDHALESPPAGCAYIRENFPQDACATCPMKAPYHLAKKSILELAQGAEEPMARPRLQAHLDRIHRFASGDQAGLPTHFDGLDEYTRFRRGELVVVGAQPSLGKTQFGIDCAYRLAKAGTAAFFFSAETGEAAFADRLLSRAAEIDSYALRNERLTGPLTPEEWTALGKATTELESLPLFLDFTSLRAEQVLAQVEGALLTHGIPLDAPYVIFFDYLQFAVKLPGEDTEYDRLTRTSSEFKFMAKLLEQTVVVFSQLRRETEGEDEPNLTWFKGTGRIEADANTAIIFTGERSNSPVVQRVAWLVKQKEGKANIKVKFNVHQAFGRWDSNPSGMAPEKSGVFPGTLGWNL